MMHSNKIHQTKDRELPQKELGPMLGGSDFK